MKPCFHMISIELLRAPNMANDPDDCNCSHLSGHTENSRISSAILAMIYPIVEELFTYNKCDC